MGRLLAALCAGLVAFVFVSGLGTAGVASTGVASAGCAHPCDGGTPTLAPPRHSAPDPCVRDVGCGGGAALATGVAVAAVLGLAGGVAALARTVWRRARFLSAPLVGRLFADGLFRPPRVLLYI